jgi:rRNA processing protein Krr1/Pno1
VAAPPVTTAKAEDLLRALGAELGLGRALEILQAERIKVRAVIRG